MPTFPRSHHKKVVEPSFLRHGSVTLSFQQRNFHRCQTLPAGRGVHGRLPHPKAETSGPVPGVNRKQHLPAALEDAECCLGGPVIYSWGSLVPSRCCEHYPRD